MKKTRHEWNMKDLPSSAVAAVYSREKEGVANSTTKTKKHKRHKAEQKTCKGTQSCCFSVRANSTTKKQQKQRETQVYEWNTEQHKKPAKARNLAAALFVQTAQQKTTKTKRNTRERSRTKNLQRHAISLPSAREMRALPTVRHAARWIHSYSTLWNAIFNKNGKQKKQQKQQKQQRDKADFWLTAVSMMIKRSKSAWATVLWL